MKAILISIKPKYCELIASGKKTVEVRKTKPKIETPFKVYIYQTLHREHNGRTYSDGKVIGAFVCDKIFTLQYSCGSYRCEGLTRLENDRVASASQLSLWDMRNYLSCNGGYAWHISDLVIYDKPKELCDLYIKRYSNGSFEKIPVPVKIPPQSWCYVEEMKGE